MTRLTNLMEAVFSLYRVPDDYIVADDLNDVEQERRDDLVNQCFRIIRMENRDRLRLVPFASLTPNSQFIKHCKAMMSEPDSMFTELAERIKRNGVLEPIYCVDEGNGTFSIADGYRRWRAILQIVEAEVPGWSMDTMVPVFVVDGPPVA